MYGGRVPEVIELEAGWRRHAALKAALPDHCTLRASLLDFRPRCNPRWATAALTNLLHPPPHPAGPPTRRVLAGLRSAVRAGDAERLLEEVKLSEAAGVRAGAYSGGMKRRLSVAIALLGDPQVCSVLFWAGLCVFCNVFGGAGGGRGGGGGCCAELSAGQHWRCW
jgi:ABC-type dipeptide/oligopeptide/nickel transport system ATPase component